MDVKFGGASIYYTYISPRNRSLNTGDKIKVRSYGSIKEVIVTKGTYKSKRKTDYEYKELEVIE